MHINADAPREVLKALLDHALLWSPVANTLHNPVHLDLRVDDVEAEVARLQPLGATIEWTIDGTADGGSRWTTMSDPQGTLFCVCTARS